MASLGEASLHFPEESRRFLNPYLPPTSAEKRPNSLYPFTTLSFAMSLDAELALSPGAPTGLSGPQSKAMTHYLRSRHDAILIGVGTAIADNPSLNCRIDGVGGYGGPGLTHQPRPVIIDPKARWDFTEEHRIFQLAREGKGRAPYIITGLETPPIDKKAVLEFAGGKYITVKVGNPGVGKQRLGWKDVLQALSVEELGSVMIEGGADVINSLLVPEYSSIISSVIITIAPTWLGQGGVGVSPVRRFDKDGKPMAAARLDEVNWHPLGADFLLCGKLKVEDA